MPKTNLMQMVRRSFHIAKQVIIHPAKDATESAGQIYESGINRRKFIVNSLKSAALLTAGSSLLQSCAKENDKDENFVSNPYKGHKIVIIGAGIAGLTCAYELKKAGFESQIYEANSRSGGRMLSVKDVVAKGVSTDLGGEFVDSNHIHLLNLAAELGVKINDRSVNNYSGLEKTVYYFDNIFYTEADVIAALLPVAAAIQADIDSLPDMITAEEPGSALTLDLISIEEYINNLNCVQWLKSLLTVAFVTEYGREAGDQSSINMLFLLSVETSNGFEIFGSSDERFKIDGGSQTITNKLAKLLQPQIHFGNSLVQINKKNNAKYNLIFSNGGGTSNEISADMVIFALPFSVLKDVSIKVELPAWKRMAINQLGYGTNAKLIMGYNERHWNTLGKSGETFTDQPFQLGWDSSELQKGTNGSYSFFMGGDAGVHLGNGTPQFQYDKMSVYLEQVFPGIGAHHNGVVLRSHWPANPYSKAAYACYKPGQWTTIAGYERKTVDSLYFCGEHCSINFQGFMNGGAETGFKTAHKIIDLLK